MQHFALKLCVATQMMRDLFKCENGQDMVEYALAMGLIALGATASMPGLATSIGTAFTSLGTKFTTYTS